MNPMQAQLNNTDAKADKALAGLQNLHLEKKLVLDSTHGPTFASGSDALTANGKREINGFIEDLEGPANTAPPSGRIFVVAGYTDNVGGESYNYQLGQRRAEGVAGYLVGKEGVDPTQDSCGLLRSEQAAGRQQHGARAANQSPGRNSRIPGEDHYRGCSGR